MKTIAETLASGKRLPRAIGHVMLDHGGELYTVPTICCSDEDRMLLMRVHIGPWSSQFIKKLMEPIE